MEILTVKNWTKFQHYKDRDPPWIKLYKSLLDDYDFCRLQDASKLHLVLIWLYAARNKGEVPNDPKFLQNRLSLSKPPDIKTLITNGFLVRASNMLAACNQDATPETYTQETYKQETEGEKKGNGAARFSRPNLQEIREYCEGINSTVNPATFFNWYESNGWKVGKNKMKDWKAAVRGWTSREGK